MSLREQKKQRTRKAILDTARHMFFQHGYTHTTMVAIAQKSEVGVGTIYNYFPSKSDLLLNLLADALSVSEIDVTPYCEHDSPVQCLMDWILDIGSFIQDYPKSFWQEVMQAIVGNVDENYTLRSGLFQLDFGFIDQTAILISKLQSQNKWNHSFSAQEAAMTLYSISMVQLMFFIYNEEMSFEEFKASLNRQITFVFASKTS
ncbi:TetR/AcrR family transcriptional regulator [Melghirimyces algeriensis]|uniref:Transcriptional regulator, TetR family n=1 Tax=Melghirimyces algeriensis TaxID=910412 RepID=A0A521AHA5_9BACL|nr:TetR/AcrR family transcriptional regulator [Melghirimyces algeriensis]SMO34182.1 transcriptional regulator, TetR family [Melghirimyces algeriensis]